MAKSLPLVIDPDPRLRQHSKMVPLAVIIEPETQAFIDSMYKTMKTNSGVGLAAVQVGRLDKIIIVDTQDGPLALFNTVIKKRSLFKEEGEEGCLSIPGVFGLVRRSKSVTVAAHDRAGKPTTFTAKGFFARVLQHEIDHTNGILFIDRTKKIITGEANHR